MRDFTKYWSNPWYKFQIRWMESLNQKSRIEAFLVFWALPNSKETFVSTNGGKYKISTKNTHIDYIKTRLPFIKERLVYRLKMLNIHLPNDFLSNDISILNIETPYITKFLSKFGRNSMFWFTDSRWNIALRFDLIKTLWWDVNMIDYCLTHELLHYLSFKYRDINLLLNQMTVLCWYNLNRLQKDWTNTHIWMCFNEWLTEVINYFVHGNLWKYNIYKENVSILNTIVKLIARKEKMAYSDVVCLLIEWYFRKWLKGLSTISQSFWSIFLKEILNLKNKKTFKHFLLITKKNYEQLWFDTLNDFNEWILSEKDDLTHLTWFINNTDFINQETFQ